ncbi:MAG: DUF1467 family protein [Pseudomonadota bacterium]
MTVGAALVLYAIIWFLVLFVVLPMNLETQDEQGEVVPGTSGSAPANPNLRRKAFIVTIASVFIWLVCAGVIVFELLPLEMFDFYNGIEK